MHISHDRLAGELARRGNTWKRRFLRSKRVRRLNKPTVKDSRRLVRAARFLDAPDYRLTRLFSSQVFGHSAWAANARPRHEISVCCLA
jgi:hypothetical protein